MHAIDKHEKNKFIMMKFFQKPKKSFDQFCRLNYSLK